MTVETWLGGPAQFAFSVLGWKLHDVGAPVPVLARCLREGGVR